MDDRLAQGYVLTIHLAGGELSPEVAQLVVDDLAHLSAVGNPSPGGTLLLHCTVSAPSEGDAVRYGAQRALTAMLGAGVDGPRVLAVDARRFSDVLV